MTEPAVTRQTSRVWPLSEAEAMLRRRVAAMNPDRAATTASPYVFPRPNGRQLTIRALEAALADPRNPWWWYAVAKAGVSEEEARATLSRRHGSDAVAALALAFGFLELRDGERVP